METQTHGGRRIVRKPAVCEKVGKSGVQVWRDVRAGKFPPPVQLGPNSIGWYEDEIDTWLASRPRRTYGAPAPKETQPDQPVENARRPKRKTKRMPPAQPAQIGTAPVPNSPRPKDLGISKIESSRPGRRAALARKPERSAVAG